MNVRDQYVFQKNLQPLYKFKQLLQTFSNIPVLLPYYDKQLLKQKLCLLKIFKFTLNCYYYYHLNFLNLNFKNYYYYLNYYFLLPFFAFIRYGIHLIKILLIIIHVRGLLSVCRANLKLHTYLNECQLLFKVILKLFLFLKPFLNIVKQFLTYQFFYNNMLNY